MLGMTTVSNFLVICSVESRRGKPLWCIYWRQKETPYQKHCITCYINIIHMRKGGLSWFLFASHLMTPVFKMSQNWGGPTILKDATCADDTIVFATKFHKSLWKLLYKQTRGGGGISGMNLVQVCSWVSAYPPYKCILEYGKSIPINV